MQVLSLELSRKRQIQRYLENGASVSWLDIQHRKDAIQYVILGIREVYDRDIACFAGDLRFAETERMRDWVIETVYQGAYLREYHLWEKDCKAYFTALRQRAGKDPLPSKIPKAVQGYPAYATSLACELGLHIDPAIVDGLEVMRQKTNIMKHDPALTTCRFLEAEEYEEAISSIESFWDALMQVDFAILYPKFL
jgi:hypothetical protein